MMETATLAGGCFWCTEAVFDDVIGVESVESGYTGGHVPDPSYKRVCEGDTGHAEAIRITFDPAVISYDELLDIFFHTHDPTQLNRQGNDVGTQYRSAIFPHSAEQEAAARAAIDKAQADWPAPIVTSIEPLGEWYPAEDYHSDYFERVGDQNPYCTVVIAPKLRKFRKSYAERLKR
ncbi:peptide-methionine (S)-S-oxide reductase MsrA [Sphingomonas sp. MAH-20]|uniref:Peptide methionine sulfoxide reductase MsrA n=1 Tax=Sphingomonas horti TaxID=2682842 RepID=A0A6I4J0Q2_9SPHN|nr:MULTISPECIES: peptide-methionine (S)-S-oxide reductase MsrA [Sphingomonas]MBA2919784.1 peptide-methionine (S)-S-oxide reductase MsrA [Sphingomonas sp. CGMCC 1.13658]MVO78025.1 peptide-methionine (S)-S-oxide reductase MsrA [Sphingomonas horti]